MDKLFPRHILEILAHSMHIAQLARQACLFGDFNAQTILHQRRTALASKYARAWYRGTRLRIRWRQNNHPHIATGVLKIIAQLGRALVNQPAMLLPLVNSIDSIFFKRAPSEKSVEMLVFYADLASALVLAGERGYFLATSMSLPKAKEFFALFEKYADNPFALQELRFF